jgi:hypothetical protein
MSKSTRDIDQRWGGRQGQRRSHVAVVAVRCDVNVNARRVTLTGGGEEDRDEDDHARRWQR